MLGWGGQTEGGMVDRAERSGGVEGTRTRWQLEG